MCKASTDDADKKDTPSLGFQRPTNNAGGLEAGMTNGQSLVVRAAKKPISTLRQPLESINMDTKQADTASYERSDVCAVSAAAIIIENVVAFEVAVAFCEKFGNDSISEMKARYELFQQMAQQICSSAFGTHLFPTRPVRNWQNYETPHNVIEQVVNNQ